MKHTVKFIINKKVYILLWWYPYMQEADFSTFILQQNISCTYLSPENMPFSDSIIYVSIRNQQDSLKVSFKLPTILGILNQHLNFFIIIKKFRCWFTCMIILHIIYLTNILCITVHVFPCKNFKAASWGAELYRLIKSVEIWAAVEHSWWCQSICIVVSSLRECLLQVKNREN